MSDIEIAQQAAMQEVTGLAENSWASHNSILTPMAATKPKCLWMCLMRWPTALMAS